MADKEVILSAEAEGKGVKIIEMPGGGKAKALLKERLGEYDVLLARQKGEHKDAPEAYLGTECVLAVLEALKSKGGKADFGILLRKLSKTHKRLNADLEMYLQKAFDLVNDLFKETKEVPKAEVKTEPVEHAVEDEAPSGFLSLDEIRAGIPPSKISEVELATAIGEYLNTQSGPGVPENAGGITSEEAESKPLITEETIAAEEDAVVPVEIDEPEEVLAEEEPVEMAKGAAEAELVEAESTGPKPDKVKTVEQKLKTPRIEWSKRGAVEVAKAAVNTIMGTVASVFGVKAVKDVPMHFIERSKINSVADLAQELLKLAYQNRDEEFQAKDNVQWLLGRSKAGEFQAKLKELKKKGQTEEYEALRQEYEEYKESDEYKEFKGDVQKLMDVGGAKDRRRASKSLRQEIMAKLDAATKQGYANTVVEDDDGQKVARKVVKSADGKVTSAYNELVVKLMKEAREKDDFEWSQQMPRIREIIDTYTEQKTTGMQAVREALNTACVASAFYTAGLSLKARPVIYSLADAYGRHQRLSKEAKKQGKEGGKLNDPSYVIKDIVYKSVRETLAELALKDAENSRKTKTMKALSFVSAAGKVARYLGIANTSAVAMTDPDLLITKLSEVPAGDIFSDNEIVKGFKLNKDLTVEGFTRVAQKAGLMSEDVAPSHNELPSAGRQDSVQDAVIKPHAQTEAYQPTGSVPENKFLGVMVGKGQGIEHSLGSQLRYRFNLSQSEAGKLAHQLAIKNGWDNISIDEADKIGFEVVKGENGLFDAKVFVRSSVDENNLIQVSKIDPATSEDITRFTASRINAKAPSEATGSHADVESPSVVQDSLENDNDPDKWLEETEKPTGGAELKTIVPRAEAPAPDPELVHKAPGDVGAAQSPAETVAAHDVSSRQESETAGAGSLASEVTDEKMVPLGTVKIRAEAPGPDIDKVGSHRTQPEYRDFWTERYKQMDNQVLEAVASQPNGLKEGMNHLAEYDVYKAGSETYFVSTNPAPGRNFNIFRRIGDGVEGHSYLITGSHIPVALNPGIFPPSGYALSVDGRLFNVRSGMEMENIGKNFKLEGGDYIRISESGYNTVDISDKTIEDPVFGKAKLHIEKLGDTTEVSFESSRQTEFGKETVSGMHVFKHLPGGKIEVDEKLSGMKIAGFNASRYMQIADSSNNLGKTALEDLVKNSYAHIMYAKALEKIDPAAASAEYKHILDRINNDAYVRAGQGNVDKLKEMIPVSYL